MKKNVYRFAAMDCIVNAISEEINAQHETNKMNLEYYNTYEEMPEYVRKEYDKRNGIIAELEDFIDKL